MHTHALACSRRRPHHLREPRKPHNAGYVADVAHSAFALEVPIAMCLPAAAFSSKCFPRRWRRARPPSPKRGVGCGWECNGPERVTHSVLRSQGTSRGALIDTPEVATNRPVRRHRPTHRGCNCTNRQLHREGERALPRLGAPRRSRSQRRRRSSRARTRGESPQQSGRAPRRAMGPRGSSAGGDLRGCVKGGGPVLAVRAPAPARRARALRAGMHASGYSRVPRRASCNRSRSKGESQISCNAPRAESTFGNGRAFLNATSQTSRWAKLGSMSRRRPSWRRSTPQLRVPYTGDNPKDTKEDRANIMKQRDLLAVSWNITGPSSQYEICQTRVVIRRRWK